jgi:hypothetical protein
MMGPFRDLEDWLGTGIPRPVPLPVSEWLKDHSHGTGWRITPTFSICATPGCYHFHKYLLILAIQNTGRSGLRTPEEPSVWFSRVCLAAKLWKSPGSGSSIIISNSEDYLQRKIASGLFYDVHYLSSRVY